MSVKASWFQIGLSNTANLNFHWRNLLDGVLRLTRGNAGSPIADVMLVKADNSVEFPGGVSGGVLGAGQTWQNMTGSRVSATTYTNSTGKPIQICITTGPGASQGLNITVAGLLVVNQSSSAGASTFAASVSAIVPAGATYSATITGGIGNWTELR